MAEQSDRPWLSNYTVEETLVVAETPDLRVLRITLAPDEVIPWHFHSNIIDTFFCIEGAVQIETRAPRNTHGLTPGEQCAVPPKTAHIVSNTSDQRCRFVLVQGVGAYDFIPVG